MITLSGEIEVKCSNSEEFNWAIGEINKDNTDQLVLLSSDPQALLILVNYNHSMEAQ